MLILGKAEMFYLIKFKEGILMEERIGFIGLYKGHKVFYDGLFYTTKIGNMTFAIDEKKVDEDMQRLV